MKIDILVCSENNIKMANKGDWYTDPKFDVGIKVRSDVSTYGNGYGEGFAWTKLKDFACLRATYRQTPKRTSFKSLSVT